MKTTIADRYIIQTHPFIDGAFSIYDAKPKSKLSATRDYTFARLSIIKKAALMGVDAGISFVVGLAEQRQRTFDALTNRRGIERRRRIANLIASSM